MNTLLRSIKKDCRNICLLAALILTPALLKAEPCATSTTGIMDNHNGTYSISGSFTGEHFLCIDALEKNAERFCYTTDKHYIQIERYNGIADGKLTFKCITNKQEAQRLKRIRETPFD